MLRVFSAHALASKSLLRIACWALAMTLCFSKPSLAFAHGGPPAVEGVLASDDHGPWLIELSEGFALRSGTDDWSFVCPALFGSDLPPLSATIADEAWVAGGMDLFRLSATPSLVATERPDLAGPHVLSLAAFGDALLALRLQPASAGGGIELVRLRGDELELLFESSVFWSSLVVQPVSDGAQAQLWLARIDGDGLELLNLSVEGQELQRVPVALAMSPLSIRLSVAGERVFAHVLDNSGYTLLYVAARGEPAFDAEIVVRSMLPVRGPVVRGGEVLLTRDDELLTWSPGSVELSDSPLGTMALSCLSADYACTQSRLYLNDRVEEAGSFDPDLAVFDLANLTDPLLFAADPELGQYCTAQWLVFRSDLMRAGITGGGAMSGLDAAVSDADAGDAGAPDDDAAIDAAVDAGSAHDGGASSALRPDGGGGCSAIRIADDASGLPSAWLALGLSATSIYLRRLRAHAHRRRLYAARSNRVQSI